MLTGRNGGMGGECRMGESGEWEVNTEWEKRGMGNEMQNGRMEDWEIEGEWENAEMEETGNV
jgi:hypothetical protein